MNLPVMRTRRRAMAVTAHTVAALGPLLLLVAGLYWLSLPHSRLEPGRRPGQPAPAAQNTPAQDLGLVLTATVGLDPLACAATPGLRVLPGTTVYACYIAANTGAFTLTAHTLSDTRTGVIWDRQSMILAPGATTNTLAAGQALGGLANISATTFVTWIAQAGPNRAVTATAHMRVEVVTPRLALTKTVGLDPAACSTTVTRTVLPRADAFYCLTVRNTGDITLTRHTLTDPKLEISRTFDTPIGPGGQLVLTDAALDQLSGAVDFAARAVSRTITNTIYYTAATISGYAANGATVVTGTTSSAVFLAGPSVAFTKTVGTSSTECATTDVLTISDASTLLYYCARIHNTGPITLTYHQLSEPALVPPLRVAFTHTLAPGSVITLNNATLLSDFDQSTTFGPFSVYNGANLVLDNTMYYTGAGLFNTTVTANDHAYVGVNATPAPTGTPTPTPTRGSNNDDDDDPTDTPTVTFTPSFTPIPPTATPTFTLTPTPITPTPTPTRSYAISFLATPTPRFISPLLMAADQAATQAALETAVAFEATAAAAQLTLTPLPVGLSPLEPPIPTETPSPTLTPTLTPTVATVLIVVTNTPDQAGASTPLSSTLPGPNGQRPIQLPPPPPTPDMLMLAAHAFDGMMYAAGWIWFVLGSLVFFTVAGVLAGLAFHQRERRRFDLYEREDDYPAPLSTPPSTPSGPPAAPDDWPASLP